MARVCIMVKWYKHVSMLMVITIFAWAISGIISRIFSSILYEPPGPQKVVPITAMNQQRQPRAKDSYEIITTRNLMGATRSGSAQTVQQPSFAELGMILKGTITGPDSFARAIIEVSKEQRLFRIGDIIGGAQLISIFRDQVVMNVNGKQQVMAFMMVDYLAKGGSNASTRYSQVASESTGKVAISSVLGLNSSYGTDFYDQKRVEGYAIDTPRKRKPRGHRENI